MAKEAGRPHERMVWLLRRMMRPGQDGFITAWQTEDVDAFVRDFPEAKKSLIIYMMGPNSSPMLNAAAKRAKGYGYITPGSIGNMDARSFQQRTWCRTWRMTETGRHFLATLPVSTELQPRSADVR